MPNPNQILPTGGMLGHRGFYLLPRRKAPLQIIVGFNVPVYNPVLTKQTAKACVERLRITLKDIPDLDLKTSWDVPQDIEGSSQV